MIHIASLLCKSSSSFVKQPRVPKAASEREGGTTSANFEISISIRVDLFF